MPQQRCLSTCVTLSLQFLSGQHWHSSVGNCHSIGMVWNCNCNPKQLKNPQSYFCWFSDIHQLIRNELELIHIVFSLLSTTIKIEHSVRRTTDRIQITGSISKQISNLSAPIIAFKWDVFLASSHLSLVTCATSPPPSRWKVREMRKKYKKKSSARERGFCSRRNHSQ